MTCEEARQSINEILIKMKDYEWKTARDMLQDLYTQLNETPYDIHKNYREGI